MLSLSWGSFDAPNGVFIGDLELSLIKLFVVDHSTVEPKIIDSLIA